MYAEKYAETVAPELGTDTPRAMAARPDITWIVVAHECRARIFEQDGMSGSLRPALHHTLYGDCDGADTQMATASLMREHRTGERLRTFAATLARMLDKAYAEGRFSSLVLVAPPQTLGTIKGALPTDLRSVLRSELNRNLIHVACFELPAHLGLTARRSAP